jgi:hypothetical protein
MNEESLIEKNYAVFPRQNTTTFFRREDAEAIVTLLHKEHYGNIGFQVIEFKCTVPGSNGAVYLIAQTSDADDNPFIGYWSEWDI